MAEDQRRLSWKYTQETYRRELPDDERNFNGSHRTGHDEDDVD